MAKKSKTETSTLVVIDPFIISDIPEVDKELNDKVNQAVEKVLQSDIRIESEPEVISALRDYIMAEIALVRTFKLIVNGEADGSTERMFRACLNAKSALREEIWGHVKGVKRKEDFSETVNQVLVDQKIIPQRALDETNQDKDG